MNSFKVGDRCILRTSEKHGDFHIPRQWFGREVVIVDLMNNTRADLGPVYRMNNTWLATEDMLEPVGGPW